MNDCVTFRLAIAWLVLPGRLLGRGGGLAGEEGLQVSLCSTRWAGRDSSPAWLFPARVSWDRGQISARARRTLDCSC